MKVITVNKHKFNVALNNKMLFVATVPAKYVLPKRIKGATVTGRKVATASFVELEKVLTPIVKEFEKALIVAEKAKKAKAKTTTKTKATKVKPKKESVKAKKVKEKTEPKKEKTKVKPKKVKVESKKIEETPKTKKNQRRQCKEI